jgi:uncharacterized membrane protein
MLFYKVPDFLSFSNSLFLFFFAVYALALWVAEWRPTRLQIAWVIVPVGFLSLWIEALGTATGWPFGTYTYGDILGWHLLGVPITISFAWLAIVTNVMLFAADGPRWKRAVEIGWWAMCFDLVLDPAAVSQTFWTWSGGGFYYDIPLSNFISWFIVAYLLSFFFPRKRTAAPVRRQALRLYQAMVLMFGALCIKSGLWLAVVFALVIIAACEWRVRHDSRSAPQGI